MSATTSEGRGGLVFAGARAATTVEAMAAAAMALAGAGAHAGAAPTQVGAQAPALVARSFGGEVIDLATLRGHVVLLNFWASWCTPCREEMPALDAMAREHAAEGLMVVGLSADDPHDRADARKIAGNFHYVLGMLPDGVNNGFGPPAALPVSYVIGADGHVAAIIQPRREGVIEPLRTAVAAALAAAARPVSP